MTTLPAVRPSFKKVLLIFLTPLSMLFHYNSLFGQINNSPGDTCTTGTTFAESLAQHVEGKILEHDKESVDNGQTWSSVIWIPTYYGYHTFLGVLDNFVASHTALTSLRTWRMVDRNYYVIQLGQSNISVRIIYDSRNSLLMLTAPAGY